jgi:hypothetical protein
VTSLQEKHKKVSKDKDATIKDLQVQNERYEQVTGSLETKVKELEAANQKLAHQNTQLKSD